MAFNSDVDRIMEEIRAEVRKIKASGDEGGRASGSVGKPKLRRGRTAWEARVRAGQILRYRDEEFIRKAYLSLLNRQPEPEGLRFWLNMLRNEGRSRVWVLRMISASREGRIHNIPIRGLKTRYALHRLVEGLRGVPVLGPGLHLLRILGRLPDRVAQLERSVKDRDSAARAKDEVSGRLGRIEDRLDRLESAVGGRARGRRRQKPDVGLREREAGRLRGGAGRRA